VCERERRDVRVGGLAFSGFKRDTFYGFFVLRPCLFLLPVLCWAAGVEKQRRG